MAPSDIVQIRGERRGMLCEGTDKFGHTCQREDPVLKQGPTWKWLCSYHREQNIEPFKQESRMATPPAPNVIINPLDRLHDLRGEEFREAVIISLKELQKQIDIQRACWPLVENSNG